LELLHVEFIGTDLRNLYHPDTLDMLRWLAVDHLPATYLKDRTSGSSRKVRPFKKRRRVFSSLKEETLAFSNKFSALSSYEGTTEHSIPEQKEVATLPSGQVLVLKKPTVVDYLFPYIQDLFAARELSTLDEAAIRITYATSWEEVQLVLYQPRFQEFPDDIFEVELELETYPESARLPLCQLANPPHQRRFSAWDWDAVTSRKRLQDSDVVSLGSTIAAIELQKRICSKIMQTAQYHPLRVGTMLPLRQL